MLAFCQILFSQNPPANCYTTMPETKISETAKNVLGTPLQSCCFAPTTGFYRDGFCHTGPNDQGVHIVCAEMTEEFLQFSKEQGNDLSTPTPWFPGLKPGDRWCLCVSRWKDAVFAGFGPPIVLEATHEAATRYVSMKLLQEYAVKK
jgi:uncharacterized protein (DUF2237 family)